MQNIKSKNRQRGGQLVWSFRYDPALAVCPIHIFGRVNKEWKASRDNKRTAHILHFCCLSNSGEKRFIWKNASTKRVRVHDIEKFHYFSRVHNNAKQMNGVNSKHGYATHFGAFSEERKYLWTALNTMNIVFFVCCCCLCV